MEVLAFKLIEKLLEELSSTSAISVSINGPLKDSATVALPTFLGGIMGGPGGAVLGAAAGTGLLGISKALGYGTYKPLITVLMEDFTETERESLYERLWTKLQGFLTCPLDGHSLAYTVISALARQVQQNPEAMDNIRNELKEALSKKHMTLC